MSDDAVIPEAVPTTDGLVNYAVTREVSGSGPNAVEILKVTWGQPLRVMHMKPLDLGEQFDLAEVTGPNAANAVWVNMATTAASVWSIEGVPVINRFTKDGIKRTLNLMKMDGLRAGIAALNGITGGEAASQDEHRTAVGN